MRRWFRVKSSKEFKNRNTLCAKYSIKEMVQTFQSIWQLFWLRLKLKLREWDLDAFRSHFLNYGSKK